MKRLFYLLSCICLSFLTQAQEIFTLQTCLQNGLQNNYALRITHNETQISKNNATLGNAGYLPTLDLSAGYKATIDNTQSKLRETGESINENGIFDQNLNAGIHLNWTLFDGFNISANYKRLKELEQQGELNTRMAIEDLISEMTAEYYNFVQQKIRLKNFRYATTLSKERLRIVQERYHIGNFSRLDYQQAKVDFNSDSAKYMKQHELLNTSRIRLNQLMANPEVNTNIRIKDSLITVDTHLAYDELWSNTLATNAQLLRSAQNTRLAQLDYKRIQSRNYPYLKLQTGYGYTFNKYDTSTYSQRGNLGFNGGLTLGMNLFDGNRRRDKTNASIVIKNTRLQREELELLLQANISNLWQAYCNNLEMLKLERQNLITAKENYDIALERYLLGNLSGIEMREAQKSLLDAEERILSAEYDSKLCEISLNQISGNSLTYLRQ